ncbi:MAG: cyclic nucleotide-binding domain-containing protein [Caldilineaceae bacterium]
MTLSNLNIIELTGYLASFLVFSTFYMKTMLPLRCVAIASNIAFITYAAMAGLYPILVLHSLLLPLNLWRLYQMHKLLLRVRAASSMNYSIDSLLPFMTLVQFKKAETLFQQGAAANKLYYLMSGSIHFPEVQKAAAPGEFIGEIGIFSAQKRRTATAVAACDSTLLTISDQKVIELVYQNPEFVLHLAQVIIRHLIHEDEPKPHQATEAPVWAGSSPRGQALLI